MTGANGTRWKSDGSYNTGQFRDGDFISGSGHQVMGGGQSFTGNWSGEKITRGTWNLGGGKSYHGSFAERSGKIVFQGNGKLTLPNGGYRDGEWDNDRFKSGQSLEIYGNGDRFRGSISNFQKFSGKYAWGGSWDTDYYDGRWANNKSNGQGTRRYRSGDRYVGNFSDDRPNGSGCYHWTDGTKWCGNWTAGKRNGAGTYTRANGQTVSQVFNMNQFVC